MISKYLTFVEINRAMKRYAKLLIPIVLVMLVVLMASFGGSNLKNSNGAPAGYSNSPADGQNCSHCMGGSAAAVTGWITSNIPATGYEISTTYTITVKATGTGKKGFEVSPQDLSGNLIGTLSAGTGNKLVGSGKYVTHSAALSSNPATWNFQWTSPSTPVGPITFYGSMAVTQSATKTTTMTVGYSTVGLAEKKQPEISVYPNPAKDKITVSLPLLQEGPVQVDLLNSVGNLVRNLSDEPSASGEYQRSFSIDQPAGIYFLKLNTGGRDYLRKLIIVK